MCSEVCLCACCRRLSQFFFYVCLTLFTIFTTHCSFYLNLCQWYFCAVFCSLSHRTELFNQSPSCSTHQKCLSTPEDVFVHNHLKIKLNEDRKSKQNPAEHQWLNLKCSDCFLIKNSINSSWNWSKSFMRFVHYSVLIESDSDILRAVMQKSERTCFLNACLSHY